MSEYIKHKTMKVETIKHKDVRGKELLYIKMTNQHEEEYLINVGEKTFNETTKLVTEDQLDKAAVEKLRKQMEKPRP